MIIKLDTTSETPLYVQLRNQIVMGVGRGELKIGQRLPTVRQMAEDLGVNTMTVNKSYAILKSEGYIEIDRRHGAKVSPQVDMAGHFQEKVEGELLLLISESSLKGLSQADFMKMCADVFSQINLSYVGGAL